MRTSVSLILTILLVGLLLAACERATQEAPVKQQVQEIIGEPLSVSFISLPSEWEPDENLTVTWQVIGKDGSNISHTAIHYDTSPHDADYKLYKKTATIKSGKTPGVFSVSIKATKEKYMYLRAHAIVGSEHVYSDEKQILIVLKLTQAEPETQPETKPAQPLSESTPEPAEPSVKEYSAEADDNAFYPSTITVPKGEKVKLTLKVKENNVYFGGLLFTSDEVNYNSGDVEPGQSTVYEFTADKSFTIKSWWPSSKRYKASLEVKVE